MDPLNALASLIVGWHKVSKLNDWIRLVFQILVSMTGSFCFVTGGSLVSVQSWPISIGSGLISAGVVLAVFIRRSALLKGMLFVFPADEAKTEIETNIQVIQR